jgi:hypothetical protein
MILPCTTPLVTAFYRIDNWGSRGYDDRLWGLSSRWCLPIRQLGHSDREENVVFHTNTLANADSIIDCLQIPNADNFSVCERLLMLKIPPSDGSEFVELSSDPTLVDDDLWTIDLLFVPASWHPRRGTP